MCRTQFCRLLITSTAVPLALLALVQLCLLYEYRWSKVRTNLANSVTLNGKRLSYPSALVLINKFIHLSFKSSLPYKIFIPPALKA
jgi:hypothetical protein